MVRPRDPTPPDPTEIDGRGDRATRMTDERSTGRGRAAHLASGLHRAPRWAGRRAWPREEG